MKIKLLALFVIFLLPLALAAPVSTLKTVEHQNGLDFELGGETFSFKPSEVTDYVSWVVKVTGGYKWGLNFTLPSEDFKVSFNFEDKQRIVTGETDYQFIINDDFFVDFQDVVDSGLDVELKNKKIEIKGFNNSLVGQLISIDPFVATTTGVNYLKKANQRKFLYNPIDDSWWTSFIGNSSCFLGSSYDNGTTWAFTNVSEGATTDYYCSIDVDDYGNIWSYWTNNTGTPIILGRVLGWNGTGFDIGNSFNITSGNAITDADFALKTCGNDVGLLYRGSVSGVETCFKACRNIQNGACNSTALVGANWNSTNQTGNSFCSLNTGAWNSNNFALDCVDGNFVGTAQLTEGANEQTRLVYGNNQGDGDWIWNTFNLFNDGTPFIASSIFHNTTTVFVASSVLPAATQEVHYRECSAETGCNVSANWSTAIQLSTSGVSSGEFGVSIGITNNSEPLCIWDTDGNSIEGAWFNSTSGSWEDSIPIVDSAGTNKYPNLMQNNSYYPAQLIWGNDTSSEVWQTSFNYTLAQYIRIRAFDEQTGNKIDFDADIYNSTDLDEYVDVSSVFKHNSQFPQGDVQIDVSNASYYGRSRLLFINDNTSADLKVYLLNATAADVIAVRFHIRTAIEVAIPNATVLVQRNIGGSIQTIGELKSDFNGDALFYLEVGKPYYLTVAHPAYVTFFGQINPSQTDYTIYMVGGGQQNASGNYTTYIPTVLDDVYWYLSPFSTWLYQDTNFTFFVESTSNNLTYWGMNITNSTNSSLFFLNDTTRPAGGTMYYWMNFSHMNASNPNVTVQVWFSHSPPFQYDVLYWIDLSGALWLYPHSLKAARDVFYESGVSNTGIALFVLFITLFIVAWIAKMNPTAGLIVAGIVISFFAFSGVFDYALVSSAGVMTLVNGTGVLILTIATAGALIYLRSPT